MSVFLHILTSVLEMAKQVAERGDKVFATCRKKESSKTGVDLISKLAGDVIVLEGIDVADDADMILQPGGF